MILSSFDDFAYVKKALKLGAVDYFHKPSMNIAEIKSAMSKIKDELTMNKENKLQAPSSIQDRDVILRNLLSGKIGDVSHVKLKEGNLYTILFTVKYYEQVMKRYTKENPAFLSNTIRHLLAELLAKENEIEFVQVEENLYAVMIGYHESKGLQASFSHVNDIVYLIHSSLKRFVNIDMVFGISEAFHSFENFNQSFEQAKQALELKFYHSNDPVFYYRPQDKDIEQKMEQINDYVMAMKNGLKEEKYDQFAKDLEAWEQYVELQECLTERDVRKIYEGLLFMLQDGEVLCGKAGQTDEIEDFLNYRLIITSCSMKG